MGRTALAILALLSLSGSAATSWSDGWVDGWVDGGSSGTALSANWAGYLNAVGPLTSVTSTFNVPSATQRNPGQAEYASVWDGIGGASMATTALVQAGIHIQVSPDGAATYSTFVEGLSYSGAFVYQTPVAVTPGNRVMVSVTEIGSTQVRYQILNQSTGVGFDHTYAFGGDSTSAEWIVEAPHYNGTLAITPRLSAVRFEDTGVTPGPGVIPITMATYPTGAPIYVASPLAHGGFTVHSQLGSPKSLDGGPHA
ncbi:MAG TPA: G1 family glutamic endopeptidase [Candidatus Nitrosotalea sp.]|nr:G1 family glutamic endopeptidase [Candidatus Nitrosotalea sp.]